MNVAVFFLRCVQL